MMQFTLNLDHSSRDTLIFGEPLDWSDYEGFKRRVNFDRLGGTSIVQSRSKL